MGACDIIYNSQTGAIFTRTPASWGKIGLFYLIYYTCLACFFAGLLAVFLYAFTDNKAPLLTGDHSVMPPNPGMGFRPRPDETKTLIKFKKSDPSTYNKYIHDMTAFLNPNNTANTYMKGRSEQTYADCSKSGGGADATQDSKPCKFLVSEHKDMMDNCVNAKYGFQDGTPCFAIKLNKIFEFVPKLIGEKDYLSLQCEGEHAADKDNIGDVSYYPKDGAVSMAFFPYLNQRQAYVSPLVFVKLNSPQTGVIIQIVCKPVNAENIKQNKQSRGDGRVTLEVMIDE